jgi:hypothetical protein
MQNSNSVSMMSGMRLIVLVAMLVTAKVSAAATWWVANNGTDSSTCGASSTTPCRTISQGIQNATDGDTINVGAGLYGNVSGTGNFTGPGDEHAQMTAVGGCVVCVTRAVRIVSVSGAAATVIAGVAGSPFNTNVQILHDGVTFGAPGAGFTLTGGNANGLTIDENNSGTNVGPPLLLQRNISIVGNVDQGDGNGFAFQGMDFIDRPCPEPVCRAVAQILFAGNEANSSGVGFSVTVGQFFGGPITLQGNFAHGAGTGFFVVPGGQNESLDWISAGTVALSNNVANNNGVGFFAVAPGQMVGNTAIGNAQAGFIVVPNGGPFSGNSALGSGGPGVIVQFSIDGGDMQPTNAFQIFSQNNFYGNDRNRSLTPINTGPFSPHAYALGPPSAHCGVVNLGALGLITGPIQGPPFPITLPASGNYWGSSSGPSSSGGGDTAGGACDINGGTTVAKPFASTQLAVTTWPPATLQLLPTVDVLYCTQGSSKYAIGAANNQVSSAVSPNASGSPSLCAVPANESSAWYIKTTTDGGKTWHWIYTLDQLGLGTNPPNP